MQMKAPQTIAAAGIAACLCLASRPAMAQELEERKEAKPGLRLTDEAVSKAVHESLAESPRIPLQQSGKVLSGDLYQKFERGFSEARKPDCLHPDAMKFQPHGLNFKLLGQEYVLEATGRIAIPFWIAAIVRGKCN
jgi:hypothetical protein